MSLEAIAIGIFSRSVFQWEKKVSENIVQLLLFSENSHYESQRLFAFLHFSCMFGCKVVDSSESAHFRAWVTKDDNSRICAGVGTFVWDPCCENIDWCLSVLIAWWMTHNLKFLQKMLCIARHDICFNTWVLVVAGLYDCMTQIAVIDTISKGKKQCHHCSRNWRVCWKSSIMLLACALGRKQHIKNLVKSKQIVLQCKYGSL
jgi:hypothetical protein